MPRLSKKQENFEVPLTATAMTLSYNIAAKIEEKRQAEKSKEGHGAR